jgi:hypothetical protein
MASAGPQDLPGLALDLPGQAADGIASSSARAQSR